MENIKIKKVKIKGDLFLDVEYTEELPDHSKKNTKLSCTVPIHEDLKYAIDCLHPHLAILCDQVQVKKSQNIGEISFPEFSVRGFSISGNDENEVVSISGAKVGKFGPVNLDTPPKKWEDPEYPFISNLGELVLRAIYEVELYLFEGKRAPEKQMSMDFGEDGAEGGGSNE